MRRLTGGGCLPYRKPYHFNSQPHKEADNLDWLITEWYKTFQLTASQGGWRWTCYMIGSRSWNFNSQPHKEADIRPMFLVYLPTVFQLTASQGGWLLYELIFCPMSCISTHSLTRRLTRNQSIVSRLRCISTHSLTRRLTHDFPTADLFFSFQLTASQGGWQRCGILPHPHGRISTHSLTRRLTLIIWVRVCIIWHFNSQPHKEADLAWNQWSDINNISTHSLTRRLTLPPSVSPQRSTNFNSQPHKEADSVVNLLFIISAYFNSQPHKEADNYGLYTISKSAAFQLTASQGGWRAGCVLRIWSGHFNSQPHKEADPANGFSWSRQRNFNSQPHKEAD